MPNFSTAPARWEARLNRGFRAEAALKGKSRGWVADQSPHFDEIRRRDTRRIQRPVEVDPAARPVFPTGYQGANALLDKWRPAIRPFFECLGVPLLLAYLKTARRAIGVFVLKCT